MRVICERRLAQPRHGAWLHLTPSDGFTLNVGTEDWQVNLVQDCYNAAKTTGLPFKLFISFDTRRVPDWISVRNLIDIDLPLGCRTRKWLDVSRSRPWMTSDTYCVIFSHL